MLILSYGDYSVLTDCACYRLLAVLWLGVWTGAEAGVISDILLWRSVNW